MRIPDEPAISGAIVDCPDVASLIRATAPSLPDGMKHAFAFRGMICPSFAISFPSRKQESAGKTGCAPHPRSRRLFATRNAAYEHTGLAEASGLPCAMALRLIRDRPGDPAFRDTIALGPLSPPSNLTPASGRRTQSTSPYAQATLVFRCLCVHRISPHVVTIASAPLIAGDGRGYASDLPDEATGIFLFRGLDRVLPICPSGYFVAGWAKFQFAREGDSWLRRDDCSPMSAANPGRSPVLMLIRATT
jgi:hypothetical protein